MMRTVMTYTKKAIAVFLTFLVVFSLISFVSFSLPSSALAESISVPTEGAPSEEPHIVPLAEEAVSFEEDPENQHTATEAFPDNVQQGQDLTASGEFQLLAATYSWDATSGTLTISGHVAGNLQQEIVDAASAGLPGYLPSSVMKAAVAGEAITYQDWQALRGPVFPVVEVIDISNTSTTDLSYYPDSTNPNLPPVKSSITTIMLPSGIATIGDSTFANLPSFRELENSFAITSIGRRAFYNTEFYGAWYDYVTFVGAESFASCRNINNVNLPRATVVGESAFSGDVLLNTVNLPRVETMGQGSLTGNSRLSFLIFGKVPQFTSTGGASMSGLPASAIVLYASGDPSPLSASNGWIGGIAHYATSYDKTVAAGDSTSLTYIIEGSTGGDPSAISPANIPAFLRVDWYKNGLVQQGTNGTLSLPSVSSADAGSYQPIVYNTSLISGSWHNNVFGRLTVVQPTVVAQTQGFTYDGLEHHAAVTIEGLPEGYTVVSAESSATVLDVTTAPVIARGDELSVLNPSGVEVGSVLNFAYRDGELSVTPAELIVTTPSASKPYDGAPLTAGPARLEGLMNGETATAVATGSQTQVGSSQNTYALVWGSADESNYRIAENLGELEVTSATGGGSATSSNNASFPKTGDGQLLFLVGSIAFATALLTGSTYLAKKRMK